jgi:PAS domain S-box-containing protein
LSATDPFLGSLLTAGETGRLIAAADWSRTPLGPIGGWPQSLRTTLGILLRSPVPMVLLWGEDGVMLYNDAYSGFAGGRHPRLLGSKVREGWPEVAAFNDHVMKVGLAGGTLAYRDQELTLHRNGAPEQVWMNLDYSPVPDESGRPAGVIAIVVETTERVRAEARLRESEDHLRHTVELNPQVPWTCDPAGAITSYSSRWLELTGQGPGEPLGDGWAKVVHPDDLAATAASFAASLASGEPIDVEYRIRIAATGGHRWMRAQARPRRDAAGTILRWYGVVEDIHDRKLAEQELRELNETLEARIRARTDERNRIWAMSRDLFAIMGFDGHLKGINPAWQATLGFDEATLLSRPFPEQVHPDDHAAVREVVARLHRGETVDRFEDRLRHADGSWRRIAWTLVPEDDIFYAVGRDVTAEREAAAALEAAEAARREADALYRAYFLNSAESLFVIAVLPDGGFSIEELNPAHQAATGLDMARIRGLPLERQVPPAVAEAVIPRYRRAVDTGQPESYRETFDTGSGTHTWDTVLVPVRGPDGRITRLVGSARDVTAQVLAEETLRQAQKMEAVGQLTGGIAHDFNNLLGAVVGALDLIRRKPADIARVTRFAEAGLQAAERGAKLTGQLLAFSRAQRIELKPVVVAALVEGMRDMLARTLGPMVRLGLEMEGKGAVLSDPTQLEMAVLNLAINARDAMPEGGALTIATRLRRVVAEAELLPGEYVELSVTDTGSGMPPDVAARAFDPFFTTKGPGKGTGLGLSQVYGIARQAGGSVRIETRPGAGTTVRMLLPRTAALPAAEEGGAAPRGGPDRASACVLVVDDDPDMRRVLVASLETLGYGVLEAEDGPSGLAVLDRGAPDLLLLDFAMPGMNGAEVARLVRQRRPELPIVFASGYADTAAIEGAAGPEARVLRKPFRMEELQAVLAEALRRRVLNAG